MGWRDVRLRLLGKGNDTITSGSGSAPQEDVGSIYSGRKKPFQKLEFLEFPESTYGWNSVAMLDSGFPPSLPPLALLSCWCFYNLLQSCLGDDLSEVHTLVLPLSSFKKTNQNPKASP